MAKKKNFIVGTNDLMQLFGVSRPTVTNWVAQGCPKKSRGKFDLAEVIKWRFDNELERLKNAATKAKLEEQDYELRVIQRKIKAIELARLEREVVNITDISEDIRELLHAIKTKLLALPKKAAPQLKSLDNLNDIETKLSAFIDETLYDIANLPNTLADVETLAKRGSSDIVSGGKAAGSAKAKRVGRRKADNK